jgi:hypothetical protein
MLKPVAILALAAVLNLVAVYAIQTSGNLARFWSLNTLVIALAIVPVQWLLAYLGRFEQFPADVAIAVNIAVVMLFAAGIQVWLQTPPGQPAPWGVILRSMAIYAPMVACALFAAFVKNAQRERSDASPTAVSQSDPQR